MTSWFNGYGVAKVMKQFGATDWCFAGFASAIVFPMYFFSVLALVDMIEYLKKSSAGIPPVTIVVLGAMWMCISVPLSFNGAYAAFK